MSGTQAPRLHNSGDPDAFAPGPGFLDEEGLAEQAGRTAPPATGAEQIQKGGAGPETTEGQPWSPDLPGPMLLEAESDAPARVEVGWAPKEVLAPRLPVGTGGWIAAGLGLLLASWAVLSLASFVVALAAQSTVLGSLALLAVTAGCALLTRGIVQEVAAYRSLSRVEGLRAVLASEATVPDVAREAALAWFRRVGSAVPDGGTVERMLQAAATVAEVRAVLRSQVQDRLQEAAARLGLRAAAEGAAMVAICPHASWDGVLAGFRALRMVRQVAALYGLRPGALMTVTLLRQVAWTAAGTAGLDLVAQTATDHLFHNLPGVKHVAGAFTGGTTAAIKLFRLAAVTAEACSPV